jgi:hypothetical protein
MSSTSQVLDNTAEQHKRLACRILTVNSEVTYHNMYISAQPTDAIKSPVRCGNTSILLIFHTVGLNTHLYMHMHI